MSLIFFRDLHPEVIEKARTDIKYRNRILNSLGVRANYKYVDEPASFPFDRQLCITEAINIERVMNLHLARCDDAAIADKIAHIFGGLADAFDEKSIALKTETG